MTGTTRIATLLSNNDGTIFFRDEYGMTVEAPVIASDAGLTIVNHDGTALQITDYGDGEAEYQEMSEGSTFGVTCQDEYIVRRVYNAGSLRWTENESET